MHKYQITYRDAAETGTCVFRASDPSHASDRFWDWYHAYYGSETCQILSITRIKS